MQVILRWIAADWRDLVLIALIVAASALLYGLWARGGFPRDTTGNGIAIGKAKAFDNRSLSLRIERLSAGLETLKVVTPTAPDGSSGLQGSSVSESSLAVAANVQPLAGSGTSDKAKPAESGGKEEDKAGAGGASDGDNKLKMAASDVLTDQLNLQSQIFNLQTLYERSLSDRIIGEWNEAGELITRPRMQTLLGFQVSLTPTAGTEDCVAVVEIAVRAKFGAEAEPVSLVALMPQEKTYNAASISTSERSIGGSAVAKILNFNLGGKNRTRQYFLHRDSDTVAFERNPQAQPALFEDGRTATVFGWEFRPVLGRRTVSPGTRQVLAVISLPLGEHEEEEDLGLEIKSRSYWRRYNSKSQTTRPKVSWLPWQLDNSRVVEFPKQELAIPNICKIQAALTPQVNRIAWVNTGKDSAAVSVTGANFYSGTQVVLGGQVYRENDGLTLKSDQAMEFRTSIESLVAGDAVVSGRFGPLVPMTMPMDRVGTQKVTALDIRDTRVSRLKNSDTYEIEVDVAGVDADGKDKDYTVEYINAFPEPILFVGNEPVDMPYDYYEWDPKKPPESTAPATVTAVDGQSVVPATTTSSYQPPRYQSTEKYVTVHAYVSGKQLAKNPTVAFRVPFCGMSYQLSSPITFSDPTVVRMGGDEKETLLRILVSQASADGTTGTSPSTVSVDLDKNYATTPELEMKDKGEYLLRVPTNTLAKYQSLVVRIGTSDSYVVRIPAPDPPLPKPSVDTGSPPPEIGMNSAGAVEWSGSSLDCIEQVKLGTSALDFVVYGNGAKLRVYLQASQTATAGKLTLECQTKSGQKLSLPVFVK